MPCKHFDPAHTEEVRAIIERLGLPDLRTARLLGCSSALVAGIRAGRSQASGMLWRLAKMVEKRNRGGVVVALAPMHYASEIIATRKALGWTRQQTAAATGLSARTVAAIETEHRAVTRQLGMLMAYYADERSD